MIAHNKKFLVIVFLLSLILLINLQTLAQDGETDLEFNLKSLTSNPREGETIDYTFTITNIGTKKYKR